MNMNKMLPEPFITSRFSVEFPTESGIESSIVKQIDLPSMESDFKWNDITVTLMNVINPPTIKPVNKLINFFKERGSLLNIFKKKSPFIIKVNSLNSVGTIIETWEIDVKKIVSVDFGIYSYAIKESVNTCKITFKPKSCTLK